MKYSGSIFGYDPGGNGSHGVAICRFKSGAVTNIDIRTFENAEEVLSLAESIDDLQAVGIDTLTCWSTGSSGWRPADLILRRHYKPVILSVTSPNSLAGSMALNGMSVLVGLRSQNSGLAISETHPKVLYFALTGNKYNYVEQHAQMDDMLGELLGVEVRTKNDHEWDAVISVLAALNGFTGKWKVDLHRLEPLGNGRLIQPCGETSYWWPDFP